MDLRSGIRDPGSGKNLFRIPDPRLKKARDPRSRIRIRNTALCSCIRIRIQNTDSEPCVKSSVADPDPLVIGTDPSIRIRTRMLRIRCLPVPNI